MKIFKQQQNVNSVISEGGWFVHKVELDLLFNIREALNSATEIITGYHSSIGLKSSIAQNADSVPAIFDVMNQSIELMELQVNYCKRYLKDSMSWPLQWTYPNIRIDVNGREDYLAPAHVDDWISFRGNRNIVVWLPVTGRGSLDICEIRSRNEVVEHPYWGVSFTQDDKLMWHRVQVEEGEALVFRDDLIHRSVAVSEEEQIRITAQLRIEDLHHLGPRYRRAVTQVVSNEIKEKQQALIRRQYYEN